MNLKLINLFSTLAIVSGCGAFVDYPTTPEIVYPLVETAFEDFQMSINKSRPEVIFESGEPASNCNQYLQFKRQSSLKETAVNYLAAQDYVMCDTLEVLKNASMNHVGLNSELDIADTLGTRLDLRSFPSSLRQRMDEHDQVLLDINSGGLISSKYSVKPDLTDWTFELRVVARIDADDNGKEDWIVWLTDKSHSGTYNIRKAFIAYNVENEPLELSPI